MISLGRLGRAQRIPTSFCQFMISQLCISLYADGMIVINGQGLLLNPRILHFRVRSSASHFRKEIATIIFLACGSCSWEYSSCHFITFRTILIRISRAVESNRLNVGDGSEAPLLTLCCDDTPLVR